MSAADWPEAIRPRAGPGDVVKTSAQKRLYLMVVEHSGTYYTNCSSTANAHETLVLSDRLDAGGQRLVARSIDDAGQARQCTQTAVTRAPRPGW